MLKAGFSRLDVTPPFGTDISGYFYRRISDGILDPLYLNTVALGNVLFVGFGGEAFTEYGIAARELAKDKFVVCAVCANGYEGYFPTEKAFAQGGYEVHSSLFTPTLQKEIVTALDEMIKKI